MVTFYIRKKKKKSAFESVHEAVKDVKKGFEEGNSNLEKINRLHEVFKSLLGDDGGDIMESVKSYIDYRNKCIEKNNRSEKSNVEQRNEKQSEVMVDFAEVRTPLAKYIEATENPSVKNCFEDVQKAAAELADQPESRHLSICFKTLEQAVKFLDDRGFTRPIKAKITEAGEIELNFGLSFTGDQNNEVSSTNGLIPIEPDKKKD